MVTTLRLLNHEKKDSGNDLLTLIPMCLLLVLIEERSSDPRCEIPFNTLWTIHSSSVFASRHFLATRSQNHLVTFMLLSQHSYLISARQISAVQ